MDNMFSEKQQRLLTEPLYSSWDAGRPFLATANVGLFYAVRQPPLVPDVLLSLDVEVPGDWLAKEHRSYFVWEFGKAPEAVVEIVSNTEGGETTDKMLKYAQIGIVYYAIYDPAGEVQSEPLRVFVLRDKSYVPCSRRVAAGPGIGADALAGAVRELGYRLAALVRSPGPRDSHRSRRDQERQRATGTRRADQERQRAEQERLRAERLASRLRELGVNPDER